MQVDTENMSLNSCDGSVTAFRRMCPDSKITQNFTVEKLKASYVVNHGEDYVVCFESLNKIARRWQMELVDRFWDANRQNPIGIVVSRLI